MSEELMSNGKAKEEGDLPERWSAPRKAEVVLRLVRGDSIDEVSRETQVPAHELEEWRRVFMATGTQGLKRRGMDPEDREVRRLQAKIGEMTMKLELSEHLIEKKDTWRERGVRVHAYRRELALCARAGARAECR